MLVDAFNICLSGTILVINNKQNEKIIFKIVFTWKFYNGAQARMHINRPIAVW